MSATTGRVAAKREAERAYSITEAAELKSVSPDFIRKAIHATEGGLAAKKPGGRYRISASALEAWWEALPDA